MVLWRAEIGLKQNVSVLVNMCRLRGWPGSIHFEVAAFCFYRTLFLYIFTCFTISCRYIFSVYQIIPYQCSTIFQYTKSYQSVYHKSAFSSAEPHNSVGSVENRRSLVRSPARPIFFPRIDNIATGFIPLSPLSIVLTVVMWESSQWFGKNIVLSTGWKNYRKEWIGALAAAI